MNLKVNFECDWVDDIDDYDNLISFLTSLKLYEIKRKEEPKKIKNKKVKIVEMNDIQEDNFVECVLQNIITPETATAIKLNSEYEKLNVKQLRQLCKEKELSGYSKLTRENLILKLNSLKENESD